MDRFVDRLPEEIIEQFQRDIAEGKTPPEIESYLRHTLPPPERQRDWRGRILPYEPPTFTTLRLTPFDDGGFFRESRLFELLMAEGILAHSTQPFGGSIGLFGLSRDPEVGLVYLERRIDHLSALLGVERRSLTDVPLDTVTRLFTRVIDRYGQVVRSAQELETYSVPYGGPFKLSAKQWQLAKPHFVAPELIPRPGGGCILRYCALDSGCATINELRRYEITIDSSYQITCDRQILSTKIFAQRPRFIH